MMRHHSTADLLKDPEGLVEHVLRRVGSSGLNQDLIDTPGTDLKNASVVLFLLSWCPDERGRPEPCVILNKRSPQVRQGGDLCCPGGGVSWPKDCFLAKLLCLPGSPLKRWPWRRRCNGTGRTLTVLLAAGLREAWEEMRLNPLRFDFFGMLPQQHLVMFDRVIYPIVGWAAPQPLRPNWEVARIVHVPLRKLIDPRHYGRFRPMMIHASGIGAVQPLRYNDFPCFIHDDEQGREMLWGATYRITQSFLNLAFDFIPPDTDRLPLAHRNLDETYLNGSQCQPPTACRTGRGDR
jgi:8-oxo-dGTP pyrophosphatase MutT (NUDIX family)